MSQTERGVSAGQGSKPDADEMALRSRLLGDAPFWRNNLSAALEAAIVGAAVAVSVAASKPWVMLLAIAVSFGSVVSLWRSVRHHWAAERVLARGELLVRVVDLADDPDDGPRRRKPELRYLASPVHLRYADWSEVRGLMEQVGRAAHESGVAGGLYMVRLGADGGCSFPNGQNPHTP